MMKIIDEATDLSEEDWATAAARIDLQITCHRAITNTAARLGVDPVALAEAAQDGTLLAALINLALAYRQSCESERGMDAWEICHNRIMTDLAALKARKAAG